MFNRLIPSVLKNKDFLKLWLAQIFSQSANQLLNFILILKVYEMTGSSTMVSLLIVCITIPPVLFGIYAGVFADRFSQKMIMYGVNFLRGLFVLSYAFLSFHLWYIFLMAFLISSVMQFFLPAEAARIPAVVKKEQYLAANSLYVSTNYAAVALGYSLVGLVQLLPKVQYQFVFISILFFIASFVLLFLPYDKGKKIEMSFAKLFMGVKQDFLESWVLIKSKASIYMPFIYLIFIWIAFGVSYVMIPSLAKEVFNIPNISISQLVVIPAVLGAITGGFLVNKICKKNKKEKVISLGILMIGFDALVISLIPNIKNILINNGLYTSLFLFLLKPIIIVALLFIIGMGAILIIAVAQTLLQENLEENHRGRTFGFLYMCTNVLNFLPVIFVGLLADILSIKTVIFIIALVVVLFGFSNLYILNKKIVKISD